MGQIKLIKQELVWKDNSPYFKQCHASACLRNSKGDLMVAYFGGTKEAEHDVGIWMSRRIDGIWQEPKRIKYIYGLPHWNPVLHADGDKVILYYKVGHSCWDWYTMVSESMDFGETWTEGREAVLGDNTARIVTKNKILVTKDGRWFGGSSIETPKTWDCCIERSLDKGKTWTKHPVPFTHQDGGEHADGVIQPALWQSEDNNLHCLMRSTRGRIFRSDSVDGGDTWCAAYSIDMPNNNSGLTLAEVPDNGLVLIYNPVYEGGARTPLSAVISRDNGNTWHDRIDLVTGEGEFSYPYAVSEGNVIDVTYTWKRAGIVHCELQII